MSKYIIFRYRSTHAVAYNHGNISYRPALPQLGRLYVIYNPSTDRPVYVGTATHVQDRFKDRTKSMRDMGFSALQVQCIQIYVVQVQLNENGKIKPSPPDENGISAGIDVEHLLIRTYRMKIGMWLRNYQKVNSHFHNKTGTTLEWCLDNAPSLPGVAKPYEYSLAVEGSL